MNKAKLKFKRLLKKHDAANMEPEYASGNVSEHSTDPGLSPDLQLPGAHGHARAGPGLGGHALDEDAISIPGCIPDRVLYTHARTVSHYHGRTQHR